MTDYVTEQEQIEALKNWFKQYSLVIFTGVVIAFLVIFGWRTWQQRHFRQLSHASAAYDEMLSARAQNNPAAARNQAEKIFKHYGSTIYGSMAALMLARDAAVNEKFQESQNHLNWIIKTSNSPSIRQIARVRLARVLTAQGKPEEALKILDDIEDKSFNGLILEEKGDAYLGMKERDKAREAYQEALNELPNADDVRPVLQMKYDNLATTIPTVSNES